MNKLLTAVLLATLAAAAYAQGVPASVTSITATNHTPGVPASVTSLRPGGWSMTPDCCPYAGGVTVGGSVSFGHGFGHDQNWNVNFGGGIGQHRRPIYPRPVYYPVYYPVYPVVAQPAPEAAKEETVETPSGNTFERELWQRAAAREDRNIEAAARGNGPGKSGDNARDASAGDPRYGEHYLDAREQSRRASAAAPAKAPPASAPAEEDNEPTLVLVLKDGTQLELRNYAIVGATIHSFDARRGRKIQLAELDLAATEKANADRGFDFKLPAR